MAGDFYQVLTAAPDKATAGNLSRTVVEAGLAACCQVIGPATSTYWWQGRVETSREWLCLVKTDRSRLKRLIRAIELAHPYDTPEVIAIPIAAGSSRYLKWLSGTAAPKRKARACR